MDKLKNVLSGNKTSDPTGPHDSHAANKADPRVDSDHVSGYGNTGGAGGLTGGNAGHHTTTGGYGGATGNTTGGYGGHSDPTGPHDSRLGNKADPRVDSDRVGGYANTVSTGGHHTQGTTGGLTGGTHNTHSGATGGLTGGSHNTHSGATGGLTGGNTHSGGYSDPSGPHDSKLANKLDPRVDSDRAGGYGNTASTGGPTTAGGLTGGTHNQHGATGGYGGRSDPTGPHDSRFANQADPRVDSDRVGGYGNTTGAGGPTGAGGLSHNTHNQHGATGGLTSGSHGTHNQHGATGGYGGHSDPTGPYDSRLGNKADPRVDSDRVGGYGNTPSTGGTHSHNTHSGNTHTGHTGAGAGGLTGTTGSGHLPGPAPDTAGPHKSNLLNKIDPRVDSDLDGSKTTGGNKTYGA